MAWITPTLADCQQRIAGAEWTAVSSAAKQVGQDAEAMAQDVIATQVGRIRGRVAARSENILGAAGTIPDELTGVFFALWVYDFFTRLPGMKRLLDDLRVNAWESAEKELEAVANGKIRIVPPITPGAPDEQVSPATIAVVSNGGRRVTRKSVSGLF